MQKPESLMRENQPDEPKRLILTKYANRRYYDPGQSRHLTLAEIRNQVKAGSNLQVTEAATSSDITAQVLTQILLEFETPKLDLLPVAMLLRLIRMKDQSHDDTLQELLLPLSEPKLSSGKPSPRPPGKDLDELLGLFD